MYDFVTFDCYGTLVDWEGGISGAISAAARAVGFDIPPEQIMHAYLQVEATVQAAEYRSYREILAEAASRTASLLGWTVEPNDAQFLAESLPGWPAFADTNPALERLKEMGYGLGILSNVDNDLLSGTLEQITVDFDLLITAESVRSYKPAFGHFFAARQALSERSWLHAAQSYFHDVCPAYEIGIPVVWVNRNAEGPTAEARPTGEVKTLLGLVEWLEKQTSQGTVET